MTPEDWRDLLITRLQDQSAIADSYESWYYGNHPLPEATAADSALYREFQRMSRTNFLGLVVDSVADRMSVEGIRLDDSAADEMAWQIWQESGLDSSQSQLFTASLYAGISYVSVWTDQDRPMMAPEHPCEVTHVWKPGRLSVVAYALKCYWDDVEGAWTSVLWDETGVWTWRTTATGPTNEWQSVPVFPPGGTKWVVDDNGTGLHMFGEVPVVPLPNNPSLRGAWDSEISNAVPIQRRINQTLLNMMVAQESVAFPQRWVTGLVVEEDADGNISRPFRSSPDALWTAEDPETKFGQFMESRLDGYLGILRSDIEAMASATQTPLFTLSAQLAVPPSAEALTAMETPLVKKVENKQRVCGEALERAIRMAMRAAGDSRPELEQAQVIWKDPSVQSEASRADAAVKYLAVGVPMEAVWERLGATPQEIARWNELSMTDALRRMILNVGTTGDLATPLEQQPPAVPDGGADTDANA